MYQFKAEQFLPVSLEKAWQFFSSPMNLSKITPPELDFQVLTSFEKEGIYEGMTISYRVKPLFGIPVKWRTRIGEVVHLKKFTDIQEKGPYKTWIHTHTFREVPGGVLMQDIVNYQLPLGWLGKWAHSLLVKKKIESIFAYREHVLNKIFTTNDKHSH